MVVADKNFWKKRRVFITGHTGFKGAWLCIWLHSLGAEVTGYALNPPTDPSLYELSKIDVLVKSMKADVRDSKTLSAALKDAAPEIVFHMAAQSLVRESYRNPVETYSTNVMGTVSLFEASRNCASIKALVNVTSDKCYENMEWVWGYRENEPLGGYDPYSSSKACAELVTSAYRNSFFHAADSSKHSIGVASARAGNVIGGGDFAKDRLVPDAVRALLKGTKIVVRNPLSFRPWQHVLEPLGGYLLLAQKLIENPQQYSGAWNFGPDEEARPVESVVGRICKKWGHNASYKIDKSEHPHEAHFLRLDCSKAKAKLGWHPRWNLDRAIDKVIEWTLAYREGRDLAKVCLAQIEEYENAENGY
ncbi:MAG TPA: CDP-glucose 4,6-dehydratase [Thermodesulfovibrionales bacterium]|nr:CDP-glucose 4,6-dehydratase [Thermodesulfovibrionales bacterium]